MKKMIFLCCILYSNLIVAQNIKSKEREKERFVSGLMKKMTLEEKVGQLWQVAGGFATGPNGSNIGSLKVIAQGRIGSVLNVSGVKNIRKYQEAAMQSRLKIPLVFGMDVIHGFRTGFPIPLGEAASFDLDLIQKGAHWTGTAAAAAGLNWTFAPMVDISWDARWGRVLEGAGEDPFYGSQVAVARVRGLQGDNLSNTNTIMACVKHFAGYGAPIAGKDYNSVDMSMGHFANFYMPPYKAAAEAGAATFMSAFNDFNNIPSTANPFLLRNLLKEKWHFKGFVVSDWGSVGELMNHRVAADKKEAAIKAISAGLDMEMVSNCYFENLVDLVKEKKVSIEVVDDAVQRILYKKFELGLFEDPFRYCDENREKETVESASSRDIARSISERSIVLLKKSDNILPFQKDLKSIALIGPLAKSKKDMCGAWSTANVNNVITLHEAMKNRGVQVNYAEGYDLGNNKIVNYDSTLLAVEKSDVVVVAIGERASESGEMRSKTDISIAAQQQELVSRLIKTGKPVVVLLMCGRPVIFNEVRDQAPNILLTWWLGSEAGPAICNVLWGDYNPSGKLPMTFPRNMGQVPINYQYKSTGRPYPGDWAAKYIDSPVEPAYPFGYGQSYTSFKYSNLKLISDNLGKGVHAKVSVDVTNIGQYDGEEVVQLYIRDEAASVTRPVKELKGFQKINLKKGMTQTVIFDIRDEELGFYDNNINFIVEKGDFTIMVGGDSENLDKMLFSLK
ncbi:glycoside hydrolase family 3 C-terminal domain-containing protein [Sphingobacterium sp. ML3W]|uniref:glycoside hydrolase family 3 N-terminal domain-containing protein n=1 Tax=Sphingobacterium sp. ML3W TaxID=1538644 RepID=UPI00249CA0E9|nr:glycoside hydrolase family 3 N-terminal domain-containing protein [Sphingobacterium sp. ML3W]WFA81345.1 glycoside hydrolase family 3 C-terminal domain-containing protein [Sphingobacterium sp. ML3W]